MFFFWLTCSSNSLSFHYAAFASAINSFSFRCFTVAIAHAVLVRFCGLQLLNQRSTDFAKDTNNCSFGCMTDAKAHTVLATT